jgi:hypothetical protein
MRPEDLRGSARDSYHMWRELGLSERAAMNALVEDGLVAMSAQDCLVENFKNLGLSESEAEIAADGRHGPSRWPASTSARSVAETTVESRALVSTVREVAESALRRGGIRARRGESHELAAVREAAWKVIIRLPSTVGATVWAAKVVEAAWPGVQLVDSQRSSSSKAVKS